MCASNTANKFAPHWEQECFLKAFVRDTSFFSCPNCRCSGSHFVLDDTDRPLLMQVMEWIVDMRIVNEQYLRFVNLVMDAPDTQPNLAKICAFSHLYSR